MMPAKEKSATKTKQSTKKTVKKKAAKIAPKKTPKKATAKKKSSQAKPRRAQKPVITPQLVEKLKREALPVYKAYEEALKLFHKKQYAKAKDRLTQVIKKFPEETEVLARVRIFLKVCERQLKSHKDTASSPEELFNQAVFYHNAGQYERALENYARALKVSKKDQDHIYYAMAATELSMGSTDKALKHLEQAIQMNQENRFFAHNDPDFQILATDTTFQELVQPD
jgi:tetratricopeptide (TPR) repeat protein